MVRSHCLDLTHLGRELVCPDTPLPGVELKNKPLCELVPIEAVASLSRLREEAKLEGGSIKRV
jgi:hypothetical protein